MTFSQKNLQTHVLMACLIAIGLLYIGIDFQLKHAQAQDVKAVAIERQIFPHAPLLGRLSEGMETSSFCGACSNGDHSACGGQSNGWSCCKSGCSGGKMQCWNVVSCDKIAGYRNRKTGDFTIVRKKEIMQSPLILVQSNSCTNWYDNLQAQIANYNSQCSGNLNTSQYDQCESWGNQLNSEMNSYNYQCG